jgi:hypothetical protein
VQKKDFVTNPLEFFKKKPFKTVSSDPDRDFELRPVSVVISGEFHTHLMQ